MNGMDDVLQRFHRVLVEEITERRPEYLDGPFTVAEIYQNLVPYGTHRDRIGIEMNGDYEDALLRLLAGEGGYLTLESAHALRELQEELDSSNPNTGLYREYAAVDVRLGSAEGSGPADKGDEPESSRQDAPAADEVQEDAMSVEDLAPQAEDALPEYVQEIGAMLTEDDSAAAPSETPDACPWCRAELPERDNLNFCPFCGTDVHLVPCPGCGEELEPDWRFCITCGTEVTG